MAKKILFVDDRSEWRFIVGAWLHGAGYAVVTAKDSGEALKQVEQSEPDLAILDVDLAGEDGIALMKALKEKHAATPVILFTGLSHDDDTMRIRLTPKTTTAVGTLVRMHPLVAALGVNRRGMDDTILRFMREGASQYVRKGKMEDLMKAVQVLLDFQPQAG